MTRCPRTIPSRSASSSFSPHSDQNSQPTFAPSSDFRKTVSYIALAAILIWVLFGFVSASFGQTFVAEWNAAAQGGVTPTGMALSTENSVTYLYVSDDPRGRVLKFNIATGAVAAE